MMTGLQGKQLIIIVLMVEAASALMAFALLAANGQPGFGALLGLSIVVIPFVIIPPTLKLLSNITKWTTLVDLYPEVVNAPEPKTRKVCSLAVRWPAMGFNNCILAASDESHLHLRVPEILQFGGMKPVSIPWAAVVDLTPSLLGRVKLNIMDAPSLWVPKELVSDEVALREAIAMDETIKADTNAST